MLAPSAPARAGARRLSGLEGPFASPPAWSPDGRELVISAARGGGLDIALVDATSGAWDWPIADASDEREPVFARGGAAILFSSNRTGAWEIHSFDRASRRVRRWTEGGGAAARPRDEGGIWFVRPGLAGLWRQGSPAGQGLGGEAPGGEGPIEGTPRGKTPGDETVLVDAGFLPTAASDWTAGGGSVWFTRWDAERTAWLARLDLATGVTSDALLLESPEAASELHAGSGLWVSADGRRALVSSIDASQSDLWLRRAHR
jgi:hypothetical protein